MKKTSGSTESKMNWQDSLDLDGFFSDAPQGTFPDGPGRDRGLYEAALHRDAPYRLVSEPGFRCCEYHLGLNIFTFGRAKLRLPFTIIGPPASVDRTGYYGSLDKLAEYYASRRGNHLVLNLPAPYTGAGACAQTLSSAVLANRFTDFAGYLKALRSPYRRRIRLAMDKIADLAWEELAPRDFDDSWHRLYLEVLGRSDFPLETLDRDFFRAHPGTMYALREEGHPLAFVLVEQREDRTAFVFGGMDYARRDDRDLYMNMLLQVVRLGIINGSREILLGQTAEDTKRRLGAVLVPRYMLYLSGNRLLTVVAGKLLNHIEYRDKSRPCNVYRQEGDSS